jgi:hypothetical protein
VPEVHDDRVRAVWECELDRLELDLIRVERLLKGLVTLPTDPWNPPAIPGQMPADLAMRAQDLLDRQHRAITELGSALAAADRQLTSSTRYAGATSAAPAVPVYLDLEA